MFKRLCNKWAIGDLKLIGTICELETKAFPWRAKDLGMLINSSNVCTNLRLNITKKSETSDYGGKGENQFSLKNQRMGKKIVPSD